VATSEIGEKGQSRLLLSLPGTVAGKDEPV